MDHVCMMYDENMMNTATAACTQSNGTRGTETRGPETRGTEARGTETRGPGAMGSRAMGPGAPKTITNSPSKAANPRTNDSIGIALV